MYEKLIENYINNKLSKEDIKNFAKKENTEITNDEIDIIYETIKKDWKTIYKGCNDDIYDIFENLKSKLSPKVYEKVLELYNNYKKKIN